MLNILKTSWLIFKRNKDYFATIFIGPLSILLVASLFLSFNSKSTVAVVNNCPGSFGTMIEESFSECDSFNYKKIEDKDISSNMVSGSADIVVVVNENAEEMLENGIDGAVVLYSIKDSDLKHSVEMITESVQAKYQNNNTDDYSFSFNEVPKKTVMLSNSLGMTLFKLITGGSLLTILILNDRKHGIRGRIYLSGVSSAVYLAGISIVFTISSIVSSLAYFLAAVIFRVDMGLPNSLMLIPLLLTTNIFASCFAIFLSSITSKPENVWTLSSAFILPASILGGGILPYDKMPESMQKIANVLPPRWLIHSLECLQKGQDFGQASVYLLMTLAFAALLFLIGVIRFRKIV
ncbi:MAG: ABC transporter permease [Ruminococcus flavefaciens]|nr:ABC transporter permease [Ruminococcus flavefaciens]